MTVRQIASPRERTSSALQLGRRDISGPAPPVLNPPVVILENRRGRRRRATPRPFWQPRSTMLRAPASVGMGPCAAG
jgi:hypothetical protein